MSALALLRILHLDELRFVVYVETFLVYVIAPSYLILIVMGFMRRRVIASVAAVLVVLHVGWFGTELFGSRQVSAAGSAQTKAITLYSHNILYENQTAELVGDQIKKTDADIVMLQEFSASDFSAINSVGGVDAYQYSFVRSLAGPRGLAIFSKYPLSETELVASPGYPQMRAVADVDGRNLVLWNVHVAAPVGDNSVAQWKGDLTQLKNRMRVESIPTLVAGDFNATWGRRPFRDLTKGDFDEAAVAVGRGHSRTWPMKGPRFAASLGGLIRLDHVLYNAGLQATALHEVDGAGSDHRGVVTNLLMLSDRAER